MGKTFLAGLAVLGVAAITLLIDGAFDLGLGNLMFGIAIGAALGLASSGGPLGRIGAFVLGVFVAMLSYPLRALVLNGSTLGLLVYMAIVIVLIAGICALTKNRMPLWAAFLGVAAVLGAYEAQFAAAPQNLLSELPAAVSTVLLPAALAFIVSIFFSTEAPPPAQQAEDKDEYNTWSQPVASTTNTNEGN